LVALAHHLIWVAADLLEVLGVIMAEAVVEEAFLVVLVEQVLVA
jgi:hypothetical protein